MNMLRETDKTPDEAQQALMEAAKKEGFGVLHVYDLQQVLTGKGFPQANACRVLEICNPAQADAVLGIDMALNMMLPCRVSVWEQDGSTRIGMVPPTELLGLVSQDPRIAEAAREVEAAMVRMIDAAV